MTKSERLLLFKRIDSLEVQVNQLKRALDAIDTLAVRHERGAIGKAQKIARSVLQSVAEIDRG